MISKASKKRQVVDKEYTKLRTEFFNKDQNKFCVAHLLGCQGNATAIHHLYFGKERMEHYIDFDNVIPVCFSCHNAIHSFISKEDAVLLGFRIINN